MLPIDSKSNNYHYNRDLKSYANSNRKSMTKAAASLWKYLLKNRQMEGYQFRRERPILNYIADFVCLDLLLIIEVDGITHEDSIQVAKDELRDKMLSEVGFYTLRFPDWMILNRLEDVSSIIIEWIQANADAPPPNPRRRGT